MTDQALQKIIQQAKDAYSAEDYPAAITGFLKASQTCTDAGDELLAAEMANNLSVAYIQNNQPQQSLEAAMGTDQIFEAHDDPAKQGIALGNIGTALEELGDLDQAVDYYTRSVECLREANEVEYRGLVQKSLSAIHIKQGNHLKGIVSMQQSLDGQKNLTPRERWLKRLLKLPFKFFK